MATRLQGITALVTGANRGLGKALVEALLAHGAARVYAGARRLDSLDDLVALGDGRVVPLALDVTSPADIAAAVAAAPDVALLVNNAGVAAHMFGDFADPSWLPAARQEFDVNVLGPLALTQAFAPVLAANGGGAVVNLLSVASFVAFPPAFTYAAAKTAMHSITQATRSFLREQGTFVAGVYPGPVDTDMATNLPFDKTAPADVATAILAGLEAGVEDILPDPVAQQMGAVYFSGPKQLETPALTA